MKKTTLNDRILILPDLHAPYEHPDSFRFFAAIAQKYQPTRVICTGDEVDKHAMSFHDHDPDLYSAGHELEEAIKRLIPFYNMFPEMDLLESNHGSMVYRKGKHHGIPRKHLRDYGEVLNAPKGWKWHPEMTLLLPTGNRCFFHHSLNAEILRVMEKRAVCVVQGHHHSKFSIQYTGNPDALLWAMQVSCSIDKDSYAFAYDSVNLPRPIIGGGIILDGFPKLLPMVLKKGGRWNNYVP